VNRYSRVQAGLPNGDSFSGALVYRYTLIGAGITGELAFAGFMSAGTRVGNSWLYERSRSNTLVESLADGDEVRPIVLDSGKRGAPISIEVYFRLSLPAIRW